MIRCTQCGARKNRATDPCIYCGAGNEHKNRTKGKLLLLIILLTALVAGSVMILAGSISGSSIADDLVDTLVIAINQNDADILSAAFPEIRFNGSNASSAFAHYYLDEYRHGLEEEYGADFYVSAVVQHIEHGNDSDLDLLTQLYDIDDIEIQNNKSIEIELTINGSKKSATETFTINIIKIDDEWYFDILDSFFLGD